MKEHHILFIVLLTLVLLFSHVFDQIGNSHVKEGVSSVLTGKMYKF